MFLGLHALLFDTRVLRHLVHNIHLRSDSLAAASWKALARIHLLVILPSAACLHAVSPSQAPLHDRSFVLRGRTFSAVLPLLLGAFIGDVAIFRHPHVCQLNHAATRRHLD